MNGEPRATAPRSAIDLVAVVVRGWRTVAVAALTTTVVALAAFFIAPDSYVSTAVLVPAIETQSRAQVGLGQLPGGVASLLGVSGGSASDRLLGVVLKSRSLADTIARRLAREGFAERTVREVLDKRTRVQPALDGSVTVQVRAPDPRMAMQIAAAYNEAANAILGRVGREGAERRRRFIAEQLSSAREQLVESEQRLLEFQQRRSAPDPPEQARRTIDAAATLQTEIFRQELDVARLRRVSTPDNPELQAAVSALATRRAQLNALTANGAGAGQLFVPLREGAALKLSALRLQREFTADERIFESLTAAAAEAQFASNDNLPAVTVLDTAQLPPGPARSYLPLFAAPVVGLVLGAGFLLARDAARRSAWSRGDTAFGAAPVARRVAS